MIAAALEAEYGELGSYGGCLGEQAGRRPQRAVHLVGGDVVEANAARSASRHPDLEQRVRADDVRLHEHAGPMNAAIDVALGREVHDSAWAMVPDEQGIDQPAVADVAAGRRCAAG